MVQRSGLDEQEIRARTQHLRVAAYTEDKLKGVEVSTLTCEEISRLVEERADNREAAPPLERVHPFSQVPALFEQGWMVVSSHGAGLAVVRSPGAGASRG